MLLDVGPFLSVTAAETPISKLVQMAAFSWLFHAYPNNVSSQLPT